MTLRPHTAGRSTRPEGVDGAHLDGLPKKARVVWRLTEAGLSNRNGIMGRFSAVKVLSASQSEGEEGWGTYEKVGSLPVPPVLSCAGSDRLSKELDAHEHDAQRSDMVRNV